MAPYTEPSPLPAPAPPPPPTTIQRLLTHRHRARALGLPVFMPLQSQIRDHVVTSPGFRAMRKVMVAQMPDMTGADVEFALCTAVLKQEMLMVEERRNERRKVEVGVKNEEAWKRESKEGGGNGNEDEEAKEIVRKYMDKLFPGIINASVPVKENWDLQEYDNPDPRTIEIKSNIESEKKAFETLVRDRKNQAEELFLQVIAAQSISAKALFAAEIRMYAEYASEAGRAKHTCKEGVDPITDYFDTLEDQEMGFAIRRLHDFQQAEVAEMTARKAEEAAHLDVERIDRELKKARSEQKELFREHHHSKMRKGRSSLTDALRAVRGFGKRQTGSSARKMQIPARKSPATTSSESTVQSHEAVDLLEEDENTLLEEKENRTQSFKTRDGQLPTEAHSNANVAVIKVPPSRDSKPLKSILKKLHSVSDTNANVRPESPHDRLPNSICSVANPPAPRYISPYSRVQKSPPILPPRRTESIISNPRVSSATATGYTKFNQNALDQMQKPPTSCAFHAHAEIQRILAAKEENERYVSVAQGPASMLKLPAIDIGRRSPLAKRNQSNQTLVNDLPPEALHRLSSTARLHNARVEKKATLQSMTNRGVAKLVSVNNPPISSVKPAPLSLQQSATTTLQPQPHSSVPQQVQPEKERRIFYNGLSIHSRRSSTLSERTYHGIISMLQNETGTIRETWTPLSCACEREPGSYDAEDRFMHLSLDEDGKREDEEMELYEPFRLGGRNTDESDGESESEGHEEFEEADWKHERMMSVCAEHQCSSPGPQERGDISSSIQRSTQAEDVPGWLDQSSTKIWTRMHLSPTLPLFQLQEPQPSPTSEAPQPSHLPSSNYFSYPSSLHLNSTGSTSSFRVQHESVSLYDKGAYTSVLSAVLYTRLEVACAEEDEQLDALELAKLNLPADQAEEVKMAWRKEREKENREREHGKKEGWAERIGDCCPGECWVCWGKGKMACECVVEVDLESDATRAHADDVAARRSGHRRAALAQPYMAYVEDSVEA